MAKKARILFVCSDGIARCQMAAGFARYLAGGDVEVECAGPSDAVNSYCQWAMNEAGIDIEGISGRPLQTKDLAAFTHIVTLSSVTAEACATVSEGAHLKHWDIPNPELVRGNPQDIITAFRSIRYQVEQNVRLLLAEALE